MNSIRIGIGYDVHPFVCGRDLILGGIRLEHDKGLGGHSDADVLIHAIIDSFCGAAGLGDIGKLFPDTSEEYKNIHSILLLERVSALLKDMGASIINIDTVVICEQPKILPYVYEMKNAISAALDNLPVERIGIKGKTTEKLGFTGRSEGIAVHAVALLQLQQNTASRM